MIVCGPIAGEPEVNDFHFTVWRIAYEKEILRGIQSDFNKNFLSNVKTDLRFKVSMNNAFGMHVRHRRG